MQGLPGEAAWNGGSERMTHGEFVTIYIMAGIGSAVAFLEREVPVPGKVTPEGLYSVMWLVLIIVVFWPMLLAYYIVRGEP